MAVVSEYCHPTKLNKINTMGGNKPPGYLGVLSFMLQDISVRSHVRFKFWNSPAQQGVLKLSLWKQNDNMSFILDILFYSASITVDFPRSNSKRSHAESCILYLPTHNMWTKQHTYQTHLILKMWFSETLPKKLIISIIYLRYLPY